MQTIEKRLAFSKEIIRFQNEKTFEKILQLTPIDIEILMEIDPKNRLPLFLDFVTFSLISFKINSYFDARLA
jgi:hypothetical protein